MDNLNIALAARTAGATWPLIAKSLDVTIDKATYHVKKHLEHKIFDVSKSSKGLDLDGTYTLSDLSDKVYIQDFRAIEIIETGDIENDGVLYVDYLTNITKDSIENILAGDEILYPENAYLVFGSVVVGKVELLKYDDVETHCFESHTPKYKVETTLEFEDMDTDDTKEPDYSNAQWNASNKFISITVGRETINANDTHACFKDALQKLIDGNIADAVELINTELKLKKYCNGHIKIIDGVLYYKDVELRFGLAKRIVERMYNKEDFEFYLPFLNNLMLNPSSRAVNRLFDFLEANDIEITKDGYFLAYKKVRSDFKDVYSGTIDNSVGSLVYMDRNLVNDDDTQTCSYGLHVCSKSYLQHFNGDKVVVCKVHPRDVVSIPVDYKNAKMRTCQYEVVSCL